MSPWPQEDGPSKLVAQEKVIPSPLESRPLDSNRTDQAHRELHQSLSVVLGLDEPRPTAAEPMEAAAVEAGAYEEMLRVVEACAARIPWRLRPHSKRRFLNDILILCTGLRPVILMDYGGTMPQLQENLCTLLHYARQETSILNPLRVMVIKDMIYLIHVKGLAEHASPNARSQHQLAFVDLEKSSGKLLSNTEENDLVVNLLSIQNLFSAKFPVDAAVDLMKLPDRTADVECTAFHITDRTSLIIDLSSFLENTRIALPSMNGWLLGYPVIYLLSTGNAEIATKNLSKHSLHICRIYVVRVHQIDSKRTEEELMSFSVPCDMSEKRDEERWAKSFIAHMNEKIERSNHVWASMRLEVEFFQSQSQVIVL